MWAVRRSASPLRKSVSGHRTAYASYLGLEEAVYDVKKGSCCHTKQCHCFHEKGLNYSDQRTELVYRMNCCSFSNPSTAMAHWPKLSLCSLLPCRKFYSPTGFNSSDSESDWENSFANLGAPKDSVNSFIGYDEEIKDVLIAKEVDPGEKSDGFTVHEGILFDDQTDVKTKRYVEALPLTQVIVEAPWRGVSDALKIWIEKGNEVNRSEIFSVLAYLHRRRLYWKALKMFEWLQESKLIELDESAYATLVDLIAKVHGLKKAEMSLEEIPEAFRNSELVHGSLLVNSVSAGNIAKSEELFRKMRDIDLPITVNTCNHLLLLYKKFDVMKMTDVLLLMEMENIKPNLLTYKLLIDSKGFDGDIDGMEQIMNTMKSENIKPDLALQVTITKHYIYAGFKEKAEALLREMEGGDIVESRAACKEMLLLYAMLGRADEVARIWEVCGSEPRLDECASAIEAWSRLGRVKIAEIVFEEMLKRTDKISSKWKWKCYNSMLNVYAKHRLLSKGEELIRRMADDGIRIGELTLDTLVKLYVQSGEVAKADSVMDRLMQQGILKPNYGTYLCLLESYAEKGDVPNSERIFDIIRQRGYNHGRMKQYQLLLQAYVNAKNIAYGFRERMKADNVFPSMMMATQLAAIDPFEKKHATDVL